jgi:hypothetical protein
VTFCYKALVPLRGAKCRNETIKQPGETLDNRGVSSSRAIIARKSLSQSLYSRPTARPGIEGVRYFSRVTRSIIAGILTVGSLDKTEPLTLPGNPEAATDQSNRDHDEKVHYGVAGKGDDRDEGYPKRAKFQTLRPPPRHPHPGNFKEREKEVIYSASPPGFTLRALRTNFTGSAFPPP